MFQVRSQFMQGRMHTPGYPGHGPGFGPIFFLVFRSLAQPTWMPRHSTSRRPDLLARGSPTDTQFSRPSCSCPMPQPPTADAAASWSRPPLRPSLGWAPGRRQRASAGKEGPDTRALATCRRCRPPATTRPHQQAPGPGTVLRPASLDLDSR